MSDTRITRHHPPRPLDEDEPGESFEGVATAARQQDEAFCAAMRAAVAKGREHVTEGIVCGPAEDRAIRHVFAAPPLASGTSWPFD